MDDETLNSYTHAHTQEQHARTLTHTNTSMLLCSEHYFASQSEKKKTFLQSVRLKIKAKLKGRRTQRIKGNV